MSRLRSSPPPTNLILPPPPQVWTWALANVARVHLAHARVRGGGGRTLSAASGTRNGGGSSSSSSGGGGVKVCVLNDGEGPGTPRGVLVRVPPGLAAPALALLARARSAVLLGVCVCVFGPLCLVRCVCLVARARVRFGGPSRE